MNRRKWANSNVLLYAVLAMALASLAYLQYRWIGQLSEREYERTRSILQLAAVQIANSVTENIYSLRQSVESQTVHTQEHDIAPFVDETEIDAIEWSATEVLNRAYQGNVGYALDTNVTLNYFTDERQVVVIPFDFNRHQFQLDHSQEIELAKEPDDHTVHFPDLERAYGGFDPSTITARVRDSGSALYFLRFKLKKDYLQHVLDSLSERNLVHTKGVPSEYATAMIASDGSLYCTTSKPSQWRNPEVKVPIFGVPPRGFRRNLPPETRPEGIPRNDIRVHGYRGDQRDSAIIDSTPRDTSIRSAYVMPSPWFLAVRNVSGSIETIVHDFRVRNLLISFGILVVLLVALGILFRNQQRAAVLAEQQVRFVAGISHELRTPIAVIRSASENIIDGVVSSKERLVMYGQLIKKETNNLWEMVERVLQYASLNGREELTLLPHNINELAEQAITRSRSFAQQAGTTIQAVLSPAPLVVNADGTLIIAAIENLLMNAIKYGKSDRPIEIKTTAERTDRHSMVVIDVIDHGAGIPKDQHKKIFEPFYRAVDTSSSSQRGHGIGLGLVKDIITLHRGTVQVASTPGSGSIFTIRLPLASVNGVSPNKTTTPAQHSQV